MNQIVFKVFVLTMKFLAMAKFAYGIAGGEQVKNGFPHAVQLSSVGTDKFICGGSIIEPRVILTAAHCLFEKLVTKRSAGSVQITAGTFKRRFKWDDDNGGWAFKDRQTRTVDRFVLHPNFNLSGEVINDIALLILKEPFSLTKKVQPVQLPSSADELCSNATFAGWGVTDWTGIASYVLKKIDLVLSDRASCNQALSLTPPNITLGAKEICSKMGRNEDICMGDSGSSFLCKPNKNVFTPPVIRGIFSWVKQTQFCGDPRTESVAVFTDVSKYLCWIYETLEWEGIWVKKDAKDGWAASGKELVFSGGVRRHQFISNFLWLSSLFTVTLAIQF